LKPDPLSPLDRLLPDTATFSPEGVLHIANHSVPDLVQHFGTPLYIFDRATIVNACASYMRAFKEFYHASSFEILYASKAYLSPLVAQIVAQQGMGLDVVSGGELMVAKFAEFPMARISFHGNNKSEDELRLALRLGVGRIVLDNWNELERLTRIAHEMKQQPTVLLRVAPDIDTDTHRYLQTGHAASKFGFPLGNGEAKAAILRIVSEGRLRLSGLHAHNGTMLRDTRPYSESIQRLLLLAEDVHTEAQWWPQEISPGGGWAVDTPENGSIPGLETLAQDGGQCVLGFRPFPGVPVAGPHRKCRPGIADCLLKVLRLVAMNAAGVRNGKIVLRHRPGLRKSLPRSHRQGAFIMLNRHLDVVGGGTVDAMKITARQTILCRGP